MIPIAHHGRKEVLLATLVALVCCALIGWGACALSGWFALLLVVPLPVWAWVVWFFRDPERTPAADAGPDAILCPADGRVADITPLGTDSPLGAAGVKIGIFMNVLDVHVNRMPCDATIDEVRHVPGTFLDARDPAATERNESATLTLTHTRDGVTHRVIVRQIAGLLARRIVTAVAPGDRLRRGERFGMIKFGSRVEVFLPGPLAGRVCVSVGTKVRAGCDVLARAAGEAPDA